MLQCPVSCQDGSWPPTGQARARALRAFKKVNILQIELFIIPLILENHITLVTVDMISRTIRYYDSNNQSQPLWTASRADKVLGHTVDFLSHLHTLKEIPFYENQWSRHHETAMPQQRDDYNCGVFVLLYARKIINQQPVNFESQDMNRYRVRLLNELVTGKLIELF